MAKRYYWMKMVENFFDSEAIKQLRSNAGGDTYVIIYLKLCLLSLNTKGVLVFNGFQATFEEELAINISEPLTDVKATLGFLQRHGLIKEVSDEDVIMLFIPYVGDNVGSKTVDADRKAEQRAKLKNSSQELLPENIPQDIIPSKTFYDDRNKRTLMGQCPTDIDIDIDIKRESEITRARAYGLPGRKNLHLTDAEYKTLKLFFGDHLDQLLNKVSSIVDQKGGIDPSKSYSYIWKIGQEDGFLLTEPIDPQEEAIKAAAKAELAAEGATVEQSLKNVDYVIRLAQQYGFHGQPYDIKHQIQDWFCMRYGREVESVALPSREL